MIELSVERRRALIDRGRAAFDRRDFYVAHEIWEEAWNGTIGPARRWVQSLIMLATALYKLDQGRADVCARLLAKAIDKLDDAPPTYEGIDLTAVERGTRELAMLIDSGAATIAVPIDLFEAVGLPIEVEPIHGHDGEGVRRR